MIFSVKLIQFQLLTESFIPMLEDPSHNSCFKGAILIFITKTRLSRIFFSAVIKSKRR